LVAAGSLVAFNCLLLKTCLSSATVAAMSAKRRVIIVADFIFVLFRICFQRCFDVLVNLCFMMMDVGRKENNSSINFVFSDVISLSARTFI
jgi:hypothetical protein